MAYYFSLLIFIFTIIIIISAATPTSSASPPSTTPQPAAPLPLNLQHQQQQQEQQFNNIINALIGAGDFGTWATILSAVNPSALPFSTKTTLFIPSDDALSHLPTTPPISFDPFIFPYHIVPNHRLSFSDLVRLRLDNRLPTLLPDKSILITNNSLSNFTLDDSRIIRPDLYTSDAVIVHGIGGILDYAVYGDGVVSSLPDSSLPPEAVASSLPPFPPLPSPTTMMGHGRSGVSCLLLCTRSVTIVISVVVVCAVLLIL